MKRVVEILFRAVWSLIDGAGLFGCAWMLGVFQDMTFKHWFCISVMTHVMAHSVRILSAAREDMFSENASGQAVANPAPQSHDQ